MRTGIAILDTIKADLNFLIAAPYDVSRIRFNDGRCDAAGRLWVGTLSDDRSQALGTLYCVERGVIRRIDNPVTVSNGLAFSNKNGTMYHADTTAHRICVYEFDVASGSISQGRLFKNFPENSNAQYGDRPDGAAIDSEDSFWCAMYEGGRFLRLSPHGDIPQEVPLPVRCPTMLAFGGRDLRTLYITTVSHKRAHDELKMLPLSGCVLSMQVDVPGRCEHAYIL